MEGRLDVETSNRPCGRISRSLAFAAMRKGEARMRRSKGPKPLRRTPLFDSPARRETPTVLIPSNRRIRTRMSGGVGGEEPRGSPLSRSLALFGHAGAARRCPFIEVKRTSQLRAPKSENDPTETSSGIGPAINLKTAKA